MNDQRHPEASTTPTAGGDERVESRRRFLKGTTLALPVVTTLTPGAAQALTSMTCGDKALLDGGLTPDFLLTPPNSDDGHYRLPVVVYDREVPLDDGNGNITMVGNEEPTYFSGIDQGQPVWRSFVDGSVVSTEDPPDLRNPPDISLTGYAIVHVSATDGSTVSVGAKDSPPNAIVTSAAGACMNSLAMHQG